MIGRNNRKGNNIGWEVSVNGKSKIKVLELKKQYIVEGDVMRSKCTSPQNLKETCGGSRNL